MLQHILFVQDLRWACTHVFEENGSGCGCYPKNVHEFYGLRGFGLGTRDDCIKPICRLKTQGGTPSSTLIVQRAHFWNSETREFS
jgi:hypothetical protein